MNILMTMFELNDYGGIVGDVELLARGLQEHGHTVHLVLIRTVDRPPYIRKATGPKGSYPSIFPGCQVHTTSGWYGVRVMGIGSAKRVEEYRAFANTYDLILHEIPNPPDIPDWQRFYEVDPPQIICAHDAHYRTFYPQLADVAHLVQGITCTNHAGYVALEPFPAPRAFIGAAHRPLDWSKQTPWGVRPKKALSAHVWKAWKHMDKVVRAVPYLKTSYLVLAGDGIEGRYMRSKDKCKPKYEGIWGRAMASGMIYRGMLTHEDLFLEYSNSRVMVDMSYSEKFAKLGNHFNRSVIESYNTGVVPLCTLENMHENNPPRVLFRAGENYVGVSTFCGEEYLAQTIDWLASARPDDAEEMIAKGRKILLDHFDYRVTSLQYLDFAAGKPAGIYASTGT